jgi:hypothetical protein
MTIRLFVGVLIPLAFVNVLLDHQAQTFPDENLTDQVDCARDPGMLQIRVIPLDDFHLIIFQKPNKAVDCDDIAAVDGFCPKSCR